MFARYLALPLALALAASLPVRAESVAPAPKPIDTTAAALVQMLQEAQGREANALVQVYVLREQLETAKRRADDAEAKAKAPETAPKAEPGK